MKKIHLQCGYEDECKNKDCLKCKKINKYNLNLSLAEETCIEDFAICDLKMMMIIHSKELELMQNIMRKLIFKIFKESKK